MSSLQQHDIPADIACCHDYERYAEQILPQPHWHYIAGGSGNESTLKANNIVFDKFGLQQTLLPDINQINTRVILNSERHENPILVAPIAYQQLAHQDGELATVQAANAQDISMVLSTLSSTSLEQVAQYQTSQPLWFQLYIQPDKEHTYDLIKRAEQAGYTSLVITLDAPINGLRNREQRHQFSLPEHIQAQNLQPYSQSVSNQAATGLSSQQVMLSRLLAQSPRWKDISDIIANTRLSVYLKGILTVSDAKKAKELGAAGIIVSNHGGRILDGVPTSIEMLPLIRQAVGHDIEILCDSGIRSGSDIFKALALGANSVLVGRPVIYGLATAGAMGVAHCLRLLKDELQLTMALTGCASISDITIDKIRLP
ncbi:alpha-hydroxy acid oxidase [Colwellia asteriadis]|uniref:Alpha-hydroxy acid oxidase n=1 Tax=Colwellia asteriadis TaxID=517723 RepID=A0ABP3WCU8_9GAMM